MNKLESRLRKLEEQLERLSPKAEPEPFVISHVIHGPDELIGYGTGDEAVLRLPGESDRALLDRAVSVARGKDDCSRFRDGNGVLRKWVHLYSIGR